MSKKPNLLFIFTDQQAANTMGAYGNEKIETPNMDKLAAKSILFENAYVSQPVCTPSRSTLLTGLYPHSNGCTENNVPLTEEIKCLPEIGNFKDYKIAYHGKWHLGNEVFSQHGFEEWVSIDDMYRKYYSKNKDQYAHSSYYHYLKENGFEPDIEKEGGFKRFSRGFCCNLPEKYSKPAFLAEQTTSFLEENKENPFILYVNFFEPHSPFIGPRDNQYNSENIELPGNFYEEIDESIPLKIKILRKAWQESGKSGFSLDNEKSWREAISNYWGLVSLVDTYLGKIINTLERLGMDENTIIVYTSDHGDMMGSHKLITKTVMYEEAVKVPLLLNIPGQIENGFRVENPVSQIDLVPTLLEAMGQNIPDKLQGYSWIPFLKDKKDLKEKNVFIEWNGPNAGKFNNEVRSINIEEKWKKIADKETIKKTLIDPVRTIITPEGWKYNCRFFGKDELYNLNTDPEEMNNLIDEGEYQELIENLYQKIISWQKRTRDPVYI